MENKGYVNYGKHIGDVKFNGFIKPPQGHKNAVHCPECDNLTWRHSPHCVCCGYEVKEHFYQKEVAINIEIVRRRLLWKLAFFLGAVVFFYWLTVQVDLPIYTPLFLMLGLALTVKPEIEKDSNKLDMLRKEQKLFWHKSKFFEKF